MKEFIIVGYLFCTLIFTSYFLFNSKKIITKHFKFIDFKNDNDLFIFSCLIFSFFTGFYIPFYILYFIYNVFYCIQNNVHILGMGRILPALGLLFYILIILSLLITNNKIYKKSLLYQQFIQYILKTKIIKIFTKIIISRD